MTETAVRANQPSVRRRPRKELAPGTAAFTVTLSGAMAITALAIDALLPAFGDIRSTFDLATDSNAVAGLVTAFLVGSGLGLIPAGLLADRFGRRPIMWGGIVIYIVGAALSALAPSLTWMMIGRLVWGMGAAGPRVAALAMVRDSYEGEQMAKQMSQIMAVFLLVPAIAPTLGAGVLAVAPWQGVMWLCAGAAVLVFLVSLRLPATMRPELRRELNPREILAGYRLVLTTPGTVPYLVAMTALMAALMSYVASSEIIIDEVFGLDDWFPLVFGGLAIFMGFSMFVNGRIVERVGLDVMIRRTMIAQVAIDAVLLVLALATGGRPPFTLFFIVFAATIGCQQILNPNLNAAAMRPLGAVAGSGTAVLGMIPMVFGALLGSRIDAMFDGSITPLATGFMIAGIIAWIGTRTAVRAVMNGAMPNGARRHSALG